MRKLLLVILILGASLPATSQIRLMYSQYMHNQLAYNPAYSEQGIAFGGLLLHRNQWTGFEGAPRTQLANVFYNLGRHSFNLQFMNDQVGPFQHVEIGASYGFKIRLGKSTTLAFGAKPSYNFYNTWLQTETYFDQGDPTILSARSETGFNIGAGLFLQAKNFFIGLSSPYLLRNNPSSSMSTGALSYNHFFLNVGARLVESDQIMFYPTAYAKAVKGAPVNLGLDLNFLISQKFWLSAGYRRGNAIIASAGYVFPKGFKLVYSYDLTTGYAINGQSTHEISFGAGISLFQESQFSKRNRLRKNGFFKKRIRLSGKF